MSKSVWWDKKLFIKTYKDGRRCGMCGKPLSIYNGDDRCKHHRTEDEEVIERIMLCPLKIRVKLWKAAIRQ